MRKSGFYHVRLPAEDWIIAEWKSKDREFLLAGQIMGYEEFEFYEIDERRIVREVE